MALDVTPMKRLLPLLALCIAPAIGEGQEKTSVLDLMDKTADQAATLPLEDPVDPALLSFDERRYLQAMMVHDGSFRGRIDGLWEAQSVEALSRQAQQQLGTPDPMLRDLGRLALEFSAVLIDQDWRPADPSESGMSFLLPMAMLEQATTGQETSWLAEDGSLLVKSLIGTPEEIEALHSAVSDAVGPNAQPFEVRRDDVQISSANRADESWIYLRSHDLMDGKKGATSIEWQPSRAADARLIVASLQPEGQSHLALPSGSLLQDAVNVVGWQGAAPQPKGQIVANGFHISPTELVTSGAVLAACGTLRLQDGTALQPRSIEPATRLAILSTDKPTHDWFALPDVAAAADPGMAVAVVKPDDTVDGEIIDPASDGAASAFASDLRFQASDDSAAAQPGSPLISKSGQLVGILLPRASGIATEPGPAPLVGATHLRHQLEWANMATPDKPPARNATIPEGAVVPLTCG